MKKWGPEAPGIILPKVSSDKLTISSVVLANRIEIQEEMDQASAFGPAKVFPNISGAYLPDQTVLLFFQLSNFEIDASSQAGYLSSAQLNSGRVPRSSPANSLRLTSSNAENRERLHLVHKFDLAGLKPGEYEVVLEIQDQIAEQSLQRRIPFHIVPSN